MPKPADHVYSLVYAEDNKPVVLNFHDLDSLALHVQTEGIKPEDDTYTLLVDGKETTWQTRLTIHVDMPQPPLEKATKTRAPRSDKGKPRKVKANGIDGVVALATQALND